MGFGLSDVKKKNHNYMMKWKENLILRFEPKNYLCITWISFYFEMFSNKITL